jgi:ribosomal-protein-alanine N-acetyltransferase
MSARAEAAGVAGLEVRISPMRRRHLRGVLRIENQVYPRPWTLGLFMSELGHRDSRVYRVARIGTTVVGYSGLMLVGPDGHVTTVAVDPAWRRCGIATRLLLDVSRSAVDLGAANLTLEVRMSNEPAKALYTRFGFAPAGVRKGYYAETGEDALVMWANDVNTPQHHARLDEIDAALPGTTLIDGSWS